jgi:hypothetical protein
MLLSDSNARGRAERLATLEDGDSNTLNCTVDNDNALSEGHSAGLPGALDTTSEECSVNYAKAWWKLGWFRGFDQMLLSMFLLMSSLYHGVENQLKMARCKIMELTAQLQNRDERLRKLVASIDELKKVTDENERRIELQRNELKEQCAILREMFIALEAKRGPCFSRICDSYFGAGAADTSREFWILRKYRHNLIIITKPYIQLIIMEAWKADLISEHVAKCATKCPTTHHDCTDGFYKALQVKVGEAPHTLKPFLLRIQEKLKDSRPCQQLCKRMLLEIGN